MATTGVNFIEFSATVNGVPSPVVVAAAPASAVQLQGSTGGTYLDKYAVDLSANASYAKTGAFFLSLSASTPATVDLTNTAAAASAAAGDTSFATVNELILTNTGAHDVTVSPGASSGFLGPLGGTSPTFAVPAGARVRWQSPAGWSTASLKNLKFDPGANACSIGVAVGGA